MTTEQMESGKLIANELFEYFDRYSQGQCTRNKALEDIAIKMHQWAAKRPIVGYVQSGSISDIFQEIISNKKQNTEKPYLFDCQIHRNDIELMERIKTQL